METEKPQRIQRDRPLTPEEADKYREVREKTAEELPELIARHEERTQAALAPVNASPIQLVAQAIQQGHSPADLHALLDFATRVKAAEDAEKFSAALAGFQAECPQILKQRIVKNKAGGEMYRFASFDDVMRIIGGLLKTYGIVTTFSMEMSGQLMNTTCRVRVGSHCETTTLPIAIPQGMNTNKAQDFGIAVSYAKRYALCAALNIVTTDEDDDASTLGDFITPKQIEEINAYIADKEKAGVTHNNKKFLDYLQVESIDKLPQRDIQKALDAITNSKIQGLKAKSGGK